MANEGTPLVGGGSNLGEMTIRLNIERIRFWGLLGGAALLMTGTFVSTFAVVFPPKPDPSSFFDKLFRGAPSDFDTTQTFIYQLFHFNHTCTMLDFNPSKTISALIIMLHTIPINFFVVCHYLRITSHNEPEFDNIKKVSKIFTPLQFIFFSYFYMVFVNSPDGEYGTKEGMTKFTLHYIPYMTWQLGMLLMAIQQCWYIQLKGLVPFSWISVTMLWRYCQFLMVMFIVYTAFCWSFILEHPLWNTESGIGNTFAKIVMYTWDISAVVVPTVFAWVESTDGNDTMFVFKELQ